MRVLFSESDAAEQQICRPRWAITVKGLLYMSFHMLCRLRPATLRCSLLFSIAILSTIFANSASADYVQKGFSVAPFIAYMPGVSPLPPELENLVTAAYQKQLTSMGRYTLNPLPREAGQAMRNAASSKLKSFVSIRDNLLTHLYEPLASVINDSACARASRIEDKARSRTFLEEKAREHGVSLSDLETTLLTSYVAVPYLSKVRREDPVEGVAFLLEGGLAWYHIDLINSSQRIEFVDTIGSFGQGGASSAYTDDRAYLARSACRDAAEMLAKDVVNTSRKLQPFLIRGSVLFVDGGLVTFDKGTAHDICLDDKYYIVEKVQNQSGGVVENKVGFMRVTGHRKLDEKANTESTARIVKKSRRILPGMSAVEHARSTIDGKLGVSYFHAEISAGSLYYKDRFYGARIQPATIDFKLFRLLSADYNLARSIGVSQLFTGFSVMVGTHSMPEEYLFDGTIQRENSNFALALEGFLSKKFYYGPLAFRIDVGGLYTQVARSYRLVEPNGYGLKSIKYDIGLTAGFVGVGCEYVLGVNTNVGFSVARLISSPTSLWNLTFDNASESVDADRRDDTPRVDISSIEYKLYFTLSIL